MELGLPLNMQNSLEEHQKSWDFLPMLPEQSKSVAVR